MRTRYRPSVQRWGKYAADEARRRGLAQVRRIDLIRALGGICVTCGERNLKRLELDHKDGRTWSPRKTSQHRRVVLYRREAAEGKLQVLCRTCNARKGSLVERPAAAAARRAALAESPEPAWVTDDLGGTETTLEPF